MMTFLKALKKRLLTVFAGLFALVLSLVPLPAAELQHLTGHVPAAVAHLRSTGRLPGTNYLRLAIGLPLRNQAGLTNLLAQLYNPASAGYRHYLTPAQFAERFGPTTNDYQSLMDFARANGLEITRTHANRTVLDVGGPASKVEQAFHVKLRLYRHPTEARSFYAPDVEPSLDLPVKILNISGLNNFSLPHPLSLVKSSLVKQPNAKPLAGSGPGGTFLGNDFRAAYLPGVTLTGLGQQVGLLEFDAGYFPGDITTYEKLAGLPNVPVTPELLDGYDGSPGSENANAECSLDIEMAVAMAPGLSRVVVYEGSVADDILNQMATDDSSSQLGSSWGFPVDLMTDQIFQQFAAQGQSFFNASGDSDAWVNGIDPPSDDPNITIVGGTTLTTAADGSWASETVWNWNGQIGMNGMVINGVGSGGGISTTYAIPEWQQGVNMALNQGSTTLRNIPDVALTADNVFVEYGGGQSNLFGGTSCATPLWAAFTALINQQAVNNGEATVGFINPAVYNLGTGANYSSLFHDITAGNNTWIESPDLFFAVPGYDLCTGWGTPAGQGLIDALVGPAIPTPPYITAQPQDQTIASGTTATFSVTAAGSLPLSYQWNFNGTSLMNATNATLTLTNVQLDQAGQYAVTVTNAFGSVPSSSASLTVQALPPAILADPADIATYVGMTAGFSVSASGSLPLAYQWFYNDTNVIAGATNATLTFSDVQLGESGNYSVVVTNAYGSELSDDATLTVSPPPPCDPAPSDLVSWWAGEGNANDVIGLNNGTAMGALGYTNGEVGQAFVFDGSTSYITVPASPSLDIGTTGPGITIECWVQPSAFDVDVSGAPIIEWDSSDDDGLQFWTGGDLYGNIKDTSDNPHTIETTAVLLDTNSWQHVALTYDKASGNAFIYLNGNVVASQNLGSFTPQTSYPVNIGRRTGQSIGLGDTYGGLMDELSIYNRALGPDEIQAIYVAGFEGKCPLPPVIVDQPISQSAVVGTAVEFRVSANGSSPLTYQWVFDDTNIILGATNATLLLNDLQLNQAGNYSVLVSNIAASVVSFDAVLTVNPSPTCTPAPSGLISWWSAEGNADDNMALNGGLAMGALEYTNGEVDQAFVFDGSSSYIVVPASPSLNIGGTGSGITIECWIQPSAFDVNVGGGPIIEWDSATDDGLQFWAGGTLFGNIKDTSDIPHRIETTTGLLSANNWQHVALTYDEASGNAFIYLNGTVVASQNLGSFIPLTSYPMNIGRRTAGIIGSGDTYGGLLDELAIYNRALGSDEIQAIYESGSEGKCPFPLVFLDQPTNQTTLVGTTTEFGVLLSGSRPIAYQWQFQGTNIIGATNASLILVNVQLNQAGNYCVLVTNAFGATNSSNAVLTVLGQPPTISTQPTNQIVVLGGTAIFDVDASGTSPLSYQWRFQGTNLIGATNALLALPDVQSDQAGNYSVLITNAFGSTLSSNASLTAVTPPECDSAPSGLVSWWPGEGSARDIAGTNNGILTGGVEFASGEVGQAFVFNGSSSYIPVPASPSLDIKGGTGLTIECWILPSSATVEGPIVEWDSSNTDGLQLWPGANLYANIKDTSGAAHTITSPNGILGTNHFQHVALTYAKSTGMAYLYLNGIQIASQNIGNITPQTTYPTYQLNIGRRTGESAGLNSTYNGLLDELSIYNRALSQGEIQAIYASGNAGKCSPIPVIVSQPTNQIVPVGSSSAFGISASGALPLAYQWIFNGTNDIAGATNATFTLANVQLANAGMYSVLITNAFGSAVSSNALLTVHLQNHFAWGAIPSPRYVNAPFTATIQAQNATNGVVTNFTGTVNLSSTLGVPIYPEISGSFVKGSWTGSVTVSQAVSNLVLQADDGLGDIGLANAINVVNPPLLGVVPTGNNLLMFWPSSVPGFVLETSTILDSNNWVKVATPPILIGNQYLESFPISDSSRFYRLRLTSP